MPNWCSNMLEVRGPIREIERFYYLNLVSDEKGKPEPLLLSTLVPPPEKHEDIGQWARDNWGVSRDVEAEVDVSLWQDAVENGASGAVLLYTIASAWAPPTIWLEKVQQLFPTLEFHLSYIEPGNGLAGEAETINGQIIDSRRDATLVDLHNFGYHGSVPELACEDCDQEEFTRFHEEGHTGVIPSQILEHCAICRHNQGLEHPADTCQICE